MFSGKYDRAARSNIAWSGEVTTMQLRDEFAEILGLYRARAPGRILEIGTFYGGTLYYWLTWAAPEATVVSVDLPPPDRFIDRSDWPRWRRNDVTLHCIQGDSHSPETLAAVAGIAGAYDWLYIDGDHSYEGVLADVQMYGPLVADGGVIVLHDILGEPGVHRVWRELCEAGYVTRAFLCDPETPLGGTGLVYIGRD